MASNDNLTSRVCDSDLTTRRGGGVIVKSIRAKSSATYRTAITDKTTITSTSGSH